MDQRLKKRNQDNYWNGSGRMGRSMNMSTNVHPLQESVDINGSVYGSLIGQVNFEVFKESGEDHPVRKIPSGNRQVIR